MCVVWLAAVFLIRPLDIFTVISDDSQPYQFEIVTGAPRSNIEFTRPADASIQLVAIT